eukprot:gene27227-biopygen7556
MNSCHVTRGGCRSFARDRHDVRKTKGHLKELQGVGRGWADTPRGPSGRNTPPSVVPVAPTRHSPPTHT